jgi:hypothetical protein
MEEKYPRLFSCAKDNLQLVNEFCAMEILCKGFIFLYKLKVTLSYKNCMSPYRISQLTMMPKMGGFTTLERAFSRLVLFVL